MTRAAIADELERLRAYADLGALPRASTGPWGTAELRSLPTDFFVTESSGLLPAGRGEHLLLRVRKTGQNTRWVAKRLAALAGVPYRAVSYAGMKDRHAVTEQWFGIHLPGLPDPVWNIDPAEGFEVLEAVRHDRKLRTGQLSYNRFRLQLRNCHISDKSQLEKCLREVAATGVPNYFGPQRFGHLAANLLLLKDPADMRRLNRDDRAFALSALRGALFNGYLATRVAAGNWRMALPGDVEISDRPRGVAEDDHTVFIAERLPAGLLWGRQASLADGSATGECEFFQQFPQVTALLEAAGSQASRRVLCARVGEFGWQWEGEQLALEFALGPGSYATAVLNELLEVRDLATFDSAA
jgi:tRNA pseudouridine13 synthase